VISIVQVFSDTVHLHKIGDGFQSVGFCHIKI
jgi:hypothetical protein